MINDPSSLLALLLFVGAIGMMVLFLPILILFWSQLEPQLVGVVVDNGRYEPDEYGSQSVLPQLMKSFGNLADETQARKPAAARTNRKKPSPAAKSKAKPTTRKAGATSSRSKATSSAKTVKTKKAATPKAKPKAAASKTKAAKSTSSAAAKKPTSKNGAKARRTPAGAKRDPILGIVYNKKPKQIDDLKEIKGVAKVIEAKLHKAGIYTYRQIIEWDAGAIEAFSDKLSFKGRIRNEGWQKQCTKFHKDKYGEKA